MAKANRKPLKARKEQFIQFRLGTSAARCAAVYLKKVIVVSSVVSEL
jgi:hypothetical protein